MKPAVAIALLLFLVTVRRAQPWPETYTSETLFVIPWGAEKDGFGFILRTQVDNEFFAQTKVPRFYDADPQGNIYIGTNISRPPHVRKYNSRGELVWKIVGGYWEDPDDGRPLSLEERKFAEIESMCCDEGGNLYVAEAMGRSGDKICKYGSNGEFVEFISTGFKKPHRLRRSSQGGVTFLAVMPDDPTGLPLAYPCSYISGVCTRNPNARFVRDAHGNMYDGVFSSTDIVDVDRSTSPPALVYRGNVGKFVLLKRIVPKTKERFWGPQEFDLEVRIPYKYEIAGHAICGSDIPDGNIYLTLYSRDERLSRSQRRRLVKVDPVGNRVLAETTLIPGSLTVDLISSAPVFVPETGEVYEFYDMLDGLRVVKYSIKRD
jgi:hypothetical protein